MVCTVDTWEFNLLAASETSTLELTVASSSSRCRTGPFADVTLTFFSNGRKPCAVTATAYVPSGMSVTRNSPFASEVTVFVRGPVRVTCAPGSGRCCGSCTIPRKVPISAAKVGSASRQKTTNLIWISYSANELLGNLGEMNGRSALLAGSAEGDAILYFRPRLDGWVAHKESADRRRILEERDARSPGNGNRRRIIRAPRMNRLERGTGRRIPTRQVRRTMVLTITAAA